MTSPDTEPKGEVTVAVTPQQLAFLALLAALIITGLRRLRRRRNRDA